MPLSLANPRYLVDDGYPLLAVEVNGRPCTFTNEWKPTLRAAGFMSTEGEFVDPDGPPGVLVDGLVVTCGPLTADVGLVELYRRFWDAANAPGFTPGPVPLN